MEVYAFNFMGFILIRLTFRCPSVLLSSTRCSPVGRGNLWRSVLVKKDDSVGGSEERSEAGHICQQPSL